MTVITVSTLAAALGVPTVTDAEVQCTPWAGRRPYVRVEGEQIIAPDTLTVTITDGVPVEPIDLEPSGAGWCWNILVFTRRPAARVRRFVAVPESGPVEFGDLVQVDPATFTPTEDVAASWEAALAGKVTLTEDPDHPGLYIIG